MSPLPISALHLLKPCLRPMSPHRASRLTSFDHSQLVGTLVQTIVEVVGILLPTLEATIAGLLGDLTWIIQDLVLTILGGLLGIL